ncbi:hypothetical protein PsYK624_047760 [Phanerochaete sordida]|uniref:Uncharacterized protein n=1 Tax=Phanerochaete sordida TaxID=48140 RepID=A0A9P3LC17_9APHY|nr:hypothetical protein PsYK624_047760 [Phanerochaete sordida]
MLPVHTAFSHGDSHDEKQHHCHSRESDALTDLLDSNILVAGLLSTAIFSITSLRHIVSNPVLRTAGHLACLIDIVGLLSSLALRLRLTCLRRDPTERGEHFAQAVRRSWSDKTISAFSPLALISSSIILFLIVLSGSLFTTNSIDNIAVPYHAYELTIMGVAFALSATQIIAVGKMCVTLG